MPFGVEKLEWCGYAMAKKFGRYVYSFWQNSRTLQTDALTDRHRMTAKAALDASIARQKTIICNNTYDCICLCVCCRRWAWHSHVTCRWLWRHIYVAAASVVVMATTYSSYVLTMMWLVVMILLVRLVLLSRCACSQLASYPHNTNYSL